MVNTPPPPNPAPQPGDGSATNQGHIDRDVNSILANLNHEQLASIVAAAVSFISICAWENHAVAETFQYKRDTEMVVADRVVAIDLESVAVQDTRVDRQTSC